jgi:hypothetical protein
LWAARRWLMKMNSGVSISRFTVSPQSVLQVDSASSAVGTRPIMSTKSRRHASAKSTGRWLRPTPHRLLHTPRLIGFFRFAALQ